MTLATPTADSGSHNIPAKAGSKGFDYSASHEDFLSSIATAVDLEALKHLRFNILTEIVQVNVSTYNHHFTFLQTFFKFSGYTIGSSE